MPSSNLHGLNIIHTQTHDSPSSDLTAPSFPDLSAQLDLWTNLAFDSDEPLISNEDNYLNIKKTSDELDDEEDLMSRREGVAMHEGHVNVVTGRPLVLPTDNTSSNTNTAPSSVASLSPSLPAFDVNSFLAGFGVDPYALPQQNLPPITPSLAQLIALHTAQTAAANASSFQTPITLNNLLSSSTNRHQDETSSPPASKRQRTRKSSISSSTIDPTDITDLTSNSSTPLTASEDKRRRNTAASARFRLKKKEREVALEGKAKDLEVRVNELERECEGLRRENGWLKGLVVGVTGVGAAAAQTSSAAGTKRAREEAVGEAKP